MKAEIVYRRNPASLKSLSWFILKKIIILKSTYFCHNGDNLDPTIYNHTASVKGKMLKQILQICLTNIIKIKRQQAAGTVAMENTKKSNDI